MSFHLKKKEKTQTLALNTNRILKYFELKQKQPAHMIISPVYVGCLPTSIPPLSIRRMSIRRMSSCVSLFLASVG